MSDQAPERIRIDEFCTVLSKDDRRVELIGGFHFYAVNVLKKTKMTHAEWMTAYEAFQTMPA